MQTYGNAQWRIYHAKEVLSSGMIFFDDMCKNCLDNVRCFCSLEKQCPIHSRRMRYKRLLKLPNIANLWDRHSGWKRTSFALSSMDNSPNAGSKRWNWHEIVFSCIKVPGIFVNRDVTRLVVNIANFSQKTWNCIENVIKNALHFSLIDIIVDFLTSIT